MARVTVLDYGYCDYVESWGSDESIISAARMSTSKGFLGWEHDQRLLSYLWKHKHTSVFEQAGLSVEIQAPIFVAREIFRHRTFSYNELSARYTKLPDLYYIPSFERLKNSKQSSSNKQASGETLDDATVVAVQSAIIAATAQSRVQYEWLLSKGISREIARLVIPMNQYTRWRMSGNLRNFLHLLSLRLGEGVQPETKDYAVAIANICRIHFPRTMQLFDNEQISSQT